MSKEIYISSTPHETRLAIVETDELTEIYYERENEYTLAGSIYNGKVTRVLPGMQSSFVDIGLERDAFLYITDFMEEAGDTAEFDTAEGGRGRSEGRRGDRAREQQRDGEPTQTAPEVDRLAAGSPESYAGEERPGNREPRGDRDARGGRRRRGSGRDRSSPSREGEREASPVERSRSSETEPVAMPDETPHSDAAPRIDSGYRAADASGSELGEGAPGADGSRRWRGRRGRRRGGRVDNAPGETLPGADSADPETLASSADPSSGYDLPDAEESAENTFSQTSGDTFADQEEVDLRASAATSETGPLSDWRGDSGSADQSRPSSADRSPREAGSGDRQERGGRDRGSRDRGGRDRGGRDRDSGGWGERSPRAPRGFTPRHTAYGLEAETEPSEAPGEPIILPGESLSKYRGGGPEGTPAAGTEPAPAVQAAPEFRLPGSWDGGNVLPGETLRPRSAAAGSAAPDSHSAGRGAESRFENRRPGDGRRGDRGRDGRGREERPRDGRDARGDRERQDRRDDRRPSGDSSTHTAAPLGLAPSLAVPSEPERSAPVEQDADGPAVATPTEAERTVREMTPAPQAVSPAPDAEYEPTEGSASFRIDPVPPREFRQPAPETAADLVEENAPEVEPSLAHSITPPPGESLAPLHEGAANQHEAAEASHVAGYAGDAVPTHDLTSIQADGEMLSAPPVPSAEAATTDPTSPLEHESAILDQAGHAQSGQIDVHADSPAESQTGSELETDDAAIDEFSPAAEFNDADSAEDDEDFHATTLHAASIEEIDPDDDDERFETLADLGSMIRDLSIDQITGPPSETSLGQSTEEFESDEDEFAFEEEDSLEDPIYGDPASSTAAHAASHADAARDSGGENSEEEMEAPRLLDGGGSGSETETDSASEPRTDHRGGRRDGRRGGRDRDRDRSRSTGDSSGERAGNGGGMRGDRRGGHRSAQTTNLPAISDLLKPGQEVLVQIAKEPIAKKGARITSHIALPGRFLVFMPTVNHTGVSRKIESDGERRRLKEILLSEKGEATGGFIVRTAASGASEEELRSDLRFLLNLWADIKQRSESSKSPALIYHDLNLVERILRDQVTDTFSAIWVDTETEYERVLRFLQRFQPSLIRRVKLYTKETPLFEQFGISEEINKALRSKVWLKSGGSIVINQTEALVAIDINTGKYVGKTARLEDTIVKTNLDAIPEIVRQIRLRDLGGIIIIDFIDMDERKNRNRVMIALEDELKKDRAPSKVLQFNDFGLVAITRKRVKQSLERTLSTPCLVCTGTGMVKSPVSVCNDIYIEMRKMQKHLDRGDVMLRVNPEVVKQLKSPSSRWLQEMEEMVGKTILVKSDPALHPEQFDIH